MVQVQLRVPKDMVDKLDQLVAEGKFMSRSDAIKTIVLLFQEKEKTKKFYETLLERSDDAKKHPELLVPFEEI